MLSIRFSILETAIYLVLLINVLILLGFNLGMVTPPKDLDKWDVFMLLQFPFMLFVFYLDHFLTLKETYPDHSLLGIMGTPPSRNKWMSLFTFWVCLQAMLSVQSGLLK